MNLRHSLSKSPCVNAHESVQLALVILLRTNWLPDMGEAFIFGPCVLFAVAFANHLKTVSSMDGTTCEDFAKASSLLQARRSMAMINDDEFVPEAGWDHKWHSSTPICWQVRAVPWKKMRSNSC